MGRIPLAALLLAGVSLFSAQLQAQEQPDAAVAQRPIGRFFTVRSPVDDRTVSDLTSLALELQAQATRDRREAVLILEIEPGSSRFGQVSDLARFLTSAQLSQIRTVAWLPKTVDGTQAILALACHDIVMHPDAMLGDIGRGEKVPDDEQNFVFSLIDRRRNVRLSRGIALAMMDPSSALMRVTVEEQPGIAQQRFLTPAELMQLRDQNAVVTKVETIKDPGIEGRFHAADSEKAGFLVARTAKNRSDVTAAFNLPPEAMREAGLGNQNVSVRVIAVHGIIDGILGEFVEREMRNAVAKGVNTLIFHIDSPGGDKDIAEHVAMAISELDATKITTVAWIPKGAWSGGALIAFGCDKVILHPEAQIGDIGVITMTEPGGQFERAPEKIVSPFLQFAATLAKRKNRPPALLQAMIDKDLTVFQVTSKADGRVTYMSEADIQASAEEWIKGPMVPESREGILLTVNGQRAHELGLADAPCRDIDELRSRLGIPEKTDLTPVASTWVDSLLVVLNSGVGGFLLMTLGIICIYIELHVPSGLFAILSTVFFALFFWSRFLGGTSGTLELVLFVLGIGLLALEVFVIPGFGVFGVSGILLTLASLVLASHTFAGMTLTEGFQESMGSLGSLAAAMVTVIAVAVVLNRFMPSIPFLNRLILTPPGFAMAGSDGPLLNPSLLSTMPVAVGAVDIGSVGITASALRPSGKAIFGDSYMDVVSDGAYVDHGTQVEVIRIAGNRIIVRVRAVIEES
jgi:membrane-bound serine protease (ClpP class)